MEEAATGAKAPERSGQRIGEYGAGLGIGEEALLQLDGLLVDAVLLKKCGEQAGVVAGVEDSVACPDYAARAVEGHRHAEARGKVGLHGRNAPAIGVVRIRLPGLRQGGIFVAQAIMQGHAGIDAELIFGKKPVVANGLVEDLVAEALRVGLPASRPGGVSAEVQREGREVGVFIGSVAIAQVADEILRVEQVEAEFPGVASGRHWRRCRQSGSGSRWDRCGADRN